MRKKIGIVLLMALLFFLPATVSAQSQYGIENYYIDATVQENGDLRVRELFFLNGEYNGFERIIRYQNPNAPIFDGTLNSFRGSDIYNGTGIKVTAVKGIKKPQIMEFENINLEGTSFKKVHSADKGDTNLYTENSKSGGIRLSIYNPSDEGLHGFYVEYTLKGMGIRHNDYAEIGWNLFSDELTESVANMEVRIHLPHNQEELRAWAHGPLNGNIELVGKREIVLTVDHISAQTAIDTRFVFDLKAIPAALKSSGFVALDNIIEIETELQKQEEFQREQYYRQLEKQAVQAVELAEKTSVREDYESASSVTALLRAGDVKTDLKNRLEKVLVNVEQREKKIRTVDVIVGSLYLLGLVFFVYKVYTKYDKEYNSDFKGKYYRDFPAEYGPSTVGYLLHRKVSNDDLSASILYLIYQKKITFEQIPNKKKDYQLHNTSAGKTMTSTEQLLLDFLFESNEKITLKELQKKAKKNYDTFILNYTAWKNAATKEAEGENFYEDINAKRAIYFLYPVVGIAFAVFTLSLPVYLVFHILVIVLSMIVIIYLFSFTKKTKKGINDYTKWIGLKNFMEDFGRMDQKELPEIVLWEKYLVYAVSLGCAEKLADTMKVRVQEFDNTYLVGNSLADFHYFNTMLLLNRTMNSTINNAMASAYSAQNSSNFSSSNGFGGGFSGGGGSFGGGGGGGRF